MTIFFCLSTLAMAQNVLVATPESSAAKPLVGITTVGPSIGPSGRSQPVGREIPSPAPMMLFVAGLSGLAAVGGRPRQGIQRDERATG